MSSIEEETELKVCVITMVYNEYFNLPLWVEYYSSQVGRQNLLIVDNDSDDASVPVIRSVPNLRYPRGTFSDTERAQFISQLAGSLLTIYDYVIYVDADEIILADPGKYSNLVDFLLKHPASAHTCIGFNLFERIGTDESYDNSKPLFAQRKSLMFRTSMCKTAIVSKPVSWSGGFHASNVAPNFSGLKLIHIKNAISKNAKSRLEITRQIRWRTDGKAGSHQRISDEKFDEISHARSRHRLGELTDNLLDEIRNALSAGIDPVSRQGGDTLYRLTSPGRQWYVELPERYSALL